MDKRPCQCQCHDPNNPHHHHHLSKKHFHIRKNLLTKTYFAVFFVSVFLIIVITIVNIIFYFNDVFLPKIFFAGMLIYFASFICSGGILGSYGPMNKSEPQLMQMRKCSSFFLLAICLLLSPIFLYKNIQFYSALKRAQLFCQENNNKSRSEMIDILIDEKNSVLASRNNLENNFKNGLSCLESQKCLRSISNSKLFICNYNYEKTYNISKCNQVFETEHLVNSFDNANVAHFASSCLELKKSGFRPDIELYKCLSEKNLCQQDSITNEDQLAIDKTFKEKKDIFDKKIAKIEEKLDSLDNTAKRLFSYEEKCYSNFEYNVFFVIIIFHILIHLIIAFTWGVLSISNILKYFGYIEDTELKYYQQKIKEMNIFYQQNQQIHSTKDIQNNNEFDETTPINVK